MFLLNALAISCGITGALIISLGIIQLVPIGYIFFAISAAATGVIQCRTPSQHGLLILTGFYFAVNIFGILRWSGVV